MNRTILMAGLLAGLAGSAALAQEATVPDAVESRTTAPNEGPGGSGMGWGLLDFATADADGDGVVTQEEVTARQQARFEQADVDGNGGLSAEELIAMQESLREEASRAAAARRIASLDDSGDGLLQAEELEARTPRIAPLFDRIDTDEDGGISQAELEAAGPLRDRGGDGFGRGRGGHGRGHGSSGEGDGWGLGRMGGLFGG